MRTTFVIGASLGVPLNYFLYGETQISFGFLAGAIFCALFMRDER